MGRPLFFCRHSTSTADLDTIEYSLRLCSLATTRNSSTTTPDVAVHLNSEVPLPNHWEQVLNIQTGEIYYINRENGRKTSVDPRGGLPMGSSSLSSGDSEAESTVDDASYDGSRSSCSSNTSNYNNGGGGSSSGRSSCHGGSSTASSTLSFTTTSSSSSVASSSSSSSWRPQRGSGDVLVLVGCRVCLTLSMVPRTEGECPKCGDAALVRF